MAAPALSLVPPPSSLYERVAEVEHIARMLESLDESEDLTTEARDQIARDLIAAIAGTRDKIDRTAAVLSQYETAAAAAQAESKRLHSRAAWFSRQHDRLTEYVLAVLAASSLEKLDGNTVTFKARRNPEAVMVDSTDEIPHEYFRYPPVPAPVPDKTLIKAALKANQPIPGCRLVQGMRLEVK